MHTIPTEVQERLAALVPFLRSVGTGGEVVKTAQTSTGQKEVENSDLLPKIVNSQKGRQQEKRASMEVPRNTLLKSASLLRSLQQDNCSLQEKLASAMKDLEAYKLATALLSDGIIDCDDLEEKIAELKEHPEKGQSLLDIPTSSHFGALKTEASGDATDPLTEYLLSTGDS